MFIPCTLVYGSCVHSTKEEEDRLSEKEKAGKFRAISRLRLVMSLDAVLFPAALAIGIIGALGLVPGLSVTASHALIGVAGGIALPWVICGIGTKGGIFLNIKDAVAFAFSKNLTISGLTD